MSVYVVTDPPALAGVYRRWDDVPRGVAGLRVHKVESEARARAVLRGEVVTLEPGLYAFTDGEGDWGGIGVVLIDQPAPGDAARTPTVRELSTHVFDVFAGAGLPSLATRERIERALPPSPWCTTTKVWARGWKAAGRRSIPWWPR